MSVLCLQKTFASCVVVGTAAALVQPVKLNSIESNTKGRETSPTLSIIKRVTAKKKIDPLLL